MSDKLLRIIVTGFISLLAACGGGGDDGGVSSGNPCSDLNLRVMGGTQCSYQQSPVVAILVMDADFNPFGICTGTMVTINDILTAAHCLNYPGTAYLGIFVGENLIEVVNGQSHPYYNGSVDSPFDIAMLTLAEPVHIGPVPILLSDLSEVGETVTAFGYGQNEEYQGAPEDFRAARMTIAQMGGGLFSTSFDDAGTSICQGDSGGPVTQTVNGITGVVGVTSWTYAGCTEGSMSGFVDTQYPEIYNFIQSYAPDVTFY